MIEPTEKMIKAGVEFALGASIHGAGGWPDYIKGLYTAMVAAEDGELSTLREKARLYDEAAGQLPHGYFDTVHGQYYDDYFDPSAEDPNNECIPLYTKPVPQALDTARPGVVLLRDRIMQMICEPEEANPDDERTVCVNYDQLYVDVIEILTADQNQEGV